MIIRRKVNDGPWEEIEVEFGVMEDDEDCEDVENECLYCSSPAHPGRYTCGRAACVGKDIALGAGFDG
jgi:hypothetical protein